MISTAISNTRLSRTTGYNIKKGESTSDTPNLRQIIAVFGQANSANEGSITVTKREITSAQEAAQIYGYGSPIHQQMRILRPSSGVGVGGVPTVVFPQLEPAGATATVHEWTVTGTATSNATHSFIIGGRQSLDFENYSYSVVTGDTATAIASKIADSINAVLGSPVTALAAAGVVTLTTKWKGTSSDFLKTAVTNNESPAGVSYSQTSTTSGTGSVSLADSLSQFGEDWYTIVLNPYGSDATILQALEDFNGVPDNENSTGRYSGITFRPFVALFGSTESDKDNLAAITDAAARRNEVTNVLCPAPNSSGFPAEAAANACVLWAITAQETPHLDANAKYYQDMPIPSNSVIGDMSSYENRDFLLKKGCSTVTLENGAYKIQDFVTTYHPEGESLPQLKFNYVRNLNIDWNIKDGISILEGIHVTDHVLVSDDQITSADKSVKPKQWKAVLKDYFSDLSELAIIEDVQFTVDSLTVEIDSSNRSRFNTFFRYKRTSVARITSTTGEINT